MCNSYTPEYLILADNICTGVVYTVNDKHLKKNDTIEHLLYFT